jgi:methionine salvage enolase-phosphatase E1
MAENVLPLFKDELLDFVAQKADDFTFKKGILDVVDKPFYRLALGLINRAVSPLVKDEYKDEFYEVQDLIVKEDYDDAGAELTDVAVELVKDWKDLPAGIGEIIIGILQTAKGILAALD